MDMVYLRVHPAAFANVEVKTMSRLKLKPKQLCLLIWRHRYSQWPKLDESWLMMGMNKGGLCGLWFATNHKPSRINQKAKLWTGSVLWSLWVFSVRCLVHAHLQSWHVDTDMWMPWTKMNWGVYVSKEVHDFPTFRKSTTKCWQSYWGGDQHFPINFLSF